MTPKKIFLHVFKKGLFASSLLVACSISVSAQETVYTSGNVTEKEIRKDTWDLHYDSVGNFNNSLAKIKLYGKYGFLNNNMNNGAQVQCIYDEASDFNDGNALVKRNGKYGLVNLNGEEVVPCQYDKIYEFDSDFMAKVVKNGKIGYINKTSGKEVIPCKYDEIGDFDERLNALVRIGSRYGLVNKVKGEIAPCQYSEIQQYKNKAMKACRNGKWGFLNARGEELVKCQYDKVGDFVNQYVYVTLNGQAGFIDEDGKQAIDCIYDQGKVTNVNFGMASMARGGRYGVVRASDKAEVLKFEFDDTEPLNDAAIKVSRGGKCGVYSVLGKEIIGCKYNDIEFLGERMLKAIDNDKCLMYDAFGKKIAGGFTQINKFNDGLAVINDKGRYGYIDPTGKKVVDTQYDSASDFNHGIAVVSKAGRYGGISTTGSIVIPLSFDKVEILDEGVVKAELNNECVLYNTSGTRISSDGFSYNSVSNFKDGLAYACRGNRYGYINKLGQEVVRCEYDEVTPFNKEGIAKVKLNGKEGYIDKDGNILVPCDYDRLGAFDKDGIARASRNGLIGFVNNKRQEIIPCKYETADNFVDDMALVSIDGRFGYVSKDGSTSINCQYDDAKPFNDGLAAVCLDGKYGYINKRNELIIPFSYEEAEPFSDGLAKVNNDRFINISGEERLIFNPSIEINQQFINKLQRYEDFEPFCEARAAVKSNGKWGFIDKEGDEIITCKYEKVEPFYMNYTRVLEDGSWKYIDRYDHTVQPPAGIFDTPRRMPSNPDYVLIQDEEDGKLGVEDLDENVIIPAEYDKIATNPDGTPAINCGLAFVTLYERSESDPEATTGNEFKGYADIRGNDTFKQSIKDKADVTAMRIAAQEKQQQLEEQRIQQKQLEEQRKLEMQRLKEKQEKEQQEKEKKEKSNKKLVAKLAISIRPSVVKANKDNKAVITITFSNVGDAPVNSSLSVGGNGVSCSTKSINLAPKASKSVQATISGIRSKDSRTVTVKVGSFGAKSQKITVKPFFEEF